MNQYFKGAINWLLILLPAIYLITIWNELPAQVPVHFNAHGVANKWAEKRILIFLPCMIPLAIYTIMRLAPILDTRDKIRTMGSKYDSLSFIVLLLISLLSVYILHLSNSYDEKKASLNVMIGFLGALFAALGNYMPTMRSNYFIGIRTPWTLESESVWKKTHILGSRMWMVGGIFSIILAFSIDNPEILNAAFIGIVLVLGVVPIVYSYLEFRREKRVV